MSLWYYINLVGGKKMYINFDSILVGMLCQFLPWFKYTLCFYLCTQCLSYLPPFVLSHLLCFYPNKEVPKNNCCDTNSFTKRLIILRKVSFKLPVFQSILEMLVFYHSKNTGLVSRGYSEQTSELKHSGWVQNRWAN